MAIYTFTKNGITITVDMPIEAVQCIEDQVLSAEKWCEGFANNVFHKVEVCRDRMIKPIVDKALETGTINTLPSTKDAIAQSIFNDVNYKKRSEREIK